MPEDSRPELAVEAMISAALQTEPLIIPPGCSVPVDAMVLSAGSSVSAPSGEPPETTASRGRSVSGADAPTQPPP